MYTDFGEEDWGLFLWISELRRDLLSGNYEDRGKHQRKLLTLERVQLELYGRYANRRNI